MSRGLGLASLALGLLWSGQAWSQGPLPGSPLDVELAVQNEPPIQLSEYWMGLECYRVPEVLRAQLNLPKDQGLAVASVLPDSPAAKAGIQAHDVLVKAGDKPLGKVQDLIEAVDAAKDKPLTLELVRGGKTMKLDVTPAKRPEGAMAAPGAPAPGMEWEQMRKWIERMRPGEEGRPPLRFRFFSPGVILPPDAAAQPPLPEGMSIAITRQGKEPAKIVVKKGNEKWEVSEKELDKLPAEVRPHVERMLGRGGLDMPGRSPLFDFVPQATTPEGEEPAKPETAAPSEGRMDKRLESLEHRLEQMRKSLEEMRENRPRLRHPEEKAKPAEEPKEKN
jgi:membrane-associated protease RseP (regulator of RpoE activity)